MIFFRTKFSFAFKSVNNIFEKKGNRFIRLWTIRGLFYSAQLVKHFSFFFITDKDYGYLLSWGLGFILWCSSFSEWVFQYTCQLLIGFGKFFPSPVLKKASVLESSDPSNRSPQLIPVSLSWNDQEYDYSPLDDVLVHRKVTWSNVTLDNIFGYSRGGHFLLFMIKKKVKK